VYIIFSCNIYLFILFPFFSPCNYKDEVRCENNNSKYGGLDLNDKELTSLIRSTGWELIKAIGRKIISGDFNLTTVSIPIKVMIPLTILQNIAKSHFNYPMYFGLASINTDPLEKFKFVMVACLTCFHRSSPFLKPVSIQAIIIIIIN
jgi:hypothetical protein